MRISGNTKLSYEFCLQFIKKQDRVLDIGCNAGALIHDLYMNGYKNIEGIDVSQKRLDTGITRYKEIRNRLYHYDGYNIPFEDETFDAVMMFDVLEHIPNIFDYLKFEVCRVLKKNGLFIFQTPNIIFNIPWEVFNNRGFKYKKYHCSLQTYCSLKRNLDNAGFENLRFHFMPVFNERNIQKLNKMLGVSGKYLLKMLDYFPCWARTNFWCSCNK